MDALTDSELDDPDLINGKARERIATTTGNDDGYDDDDAMMMTMMMVMMMVIMVVVMMMMLCYYHVVYCPLSCSSSRYVSIMLYGDGDQLS